MKARIPGKSQCQQCYDRMVNEYQHEIFTSCADSVTSGVLCMAIWALELRGVSEDDIKGFIDDFLFVTQTDNALGKTLRTEDAIKAYSEKYGIDFDSIHVNCESREHFMTRCRKEYQNEK